MFSILMICLFCNSEINYDSAKIQKDRFSIIKCHPCDVEFGIKNDNFISFEFEIKPNVTIMYEIEEGFSLWKWIDWQTLRDDLPNPILIPEGLFSGLVIDSKEKMSKKINTILNFL